MATEQLTPGAKEASLIEHLNSVGSEVVQLEQRVAVLEAAHADALLGLRLEEADTTAAEVERLRPLIVAGNARLVTIKAAIAVVADQRAKIDMETKLVKSETQFSELKESVQTALDEVRAAFAEARELLTRAKEVERELMTAEGEVRWMKTELSQWGPQPTTHAQYWSAQRPVTTFMDNTPGMPEFMRGPLGRR
jgi:chromosome segregation ATPase